MVMDFESFRKRKVSTSELLEKISADGAKNGSFKSDFYYPKVDENTGKANVVIRFLPEKTTDLPYVTVYSHGFKGDTNKWLISELCPTTIGQHCPICAKNSELWNSGTKENQDIARARKRKKNYIFNILVISDPSTPENEGKVFPYKCGPAVFKKLEEALKPEFDGEEVLEPFDIETGHNFYLRISRDPNKNNQVTYDACKFENKATSIAEDEEKLKKIFEDMRDLNSYLDESHITSDIENRTEEAYSICCPSAFVNTKGNSKRETLDKSMNARKNEAIDKLPWDDVPETPVKGSESSEEDDLAYFKDLANKMS